MKAIAIVLAGTLATASITSAQERQTPDPAVVEKRNALEKELEEVAMIERKVMVPMRDGKRMATDIYRPELDFTQLCGIAEGLL
jgi:predicted acyl esterase